MIASLADVEFINLPLFKHSINSFSPEFNRKVNYRFLLFLLQIVICIDEVQV